MEPCVEKQLIENGGGGFMEEDELVLHVGYSSKSRSRKMLRLR